MIVSRVIAVAVTALASAAALPAAPASAAYDGMRLDCVQGFSLTRSNGAAWRGLTEDGSWNGATYTTISIVVTGTGGGVEYSHEYGQKAGVARVDCTAPHDGALWSLVLAK